MTRLRKLRQERNETIATVAVAVGVSIPTVSSWERGVSIPSEYNAAKLAEHFNATVEELELGRRRQPGNPLYTRPRD